MVIDRTIISSAAGRGKVVFTLPEYPEGSLAKLLVRQHPLYGPKSSFSEIIKVVISLSALYESVCHVKELFLSSKTSI